MTLSYTRRFRFGIPDFNSGPWHADFQNMVQKIDAVLYNQLQATASVWVNSTAYVIGDFVISPVDGTMWSCAVAHTSSASPTTFSGERILHPTYWNSFLGEASDIPFTPAGGLLSTDVQSALAELGILKANLSAISPVGASGAASDLIDSEVAWVPVLTCATPTDLVVAYATQVGWLHTFGNFVRASFSITASTWTYTGASSGAIRITGLPFTSANVTSKIERGVIAASNFTRAGFTQLACNIGVNTNIITFSGFGSGVASAALQVGDFPSGGNTQLIGNIWFVKQ